MQQGYYVQRKRERYGPYSRAELENHAREGLISGRDKVYDPATCTWQLAGRTPGLVGPAGGPLRVGIPPWLGILTAIVLALVPALFLLVGALTPGQTHDADTDDAPQASDEVSGIPPEGRYFHGSITLNHIEPVRQSTEEFFLVIWDSNGTLSCEFKIGPADNPPDSFGELVRRNGDTYVFETPRAELLYTITVTLDGESVSGTLNGIEQWSLEDSPFSATAIDPDEYGEGSFSTDALRGGAPD
ncbi:MAG: hypothetical protein Kow0056_11790 [Coriobacteriia bacterium]